MLKRRMNLHFKLNTCSRPPFQGSCRDQGLKRETYKLKIGMNKYLILIFRCHSKTEGQRNSNNNPIQSCITVKSGLGEVDTIVNNRFQ